MISQAESGQAGAGTAGADKSHRLCLAVSDQKQVCVQCDMNTNKVLEFDQDHCGNDRKRKTGSVAAQAMCGLCKQSVKGHGGFVNNQSTMDGDWRGTAVAGTHAHDKRWTLTQQETVVAEPRIPEHAQMTRCFLSVAKMKGSSH